MIPTESSPASGLADGNAFFFNKLMEGSQPVGVIMAQGAVEIEKDPFNISAVKLAVCAVAVAHRGLLYLIKLSTTDKVHFNFIALLVALAAKFRILIASA